MSFHFVMWCFLKQYYFFVRKTCYWWNKNIHARKPHFQKSWTGWDRVNWVLKLSSRFGFPFLETEGRLLLILVCPPPPPPPPPKHTHTHEKNERLVYDLTWQSRVLLRRPTFLKNLEERPPLPLLPLSVRSWTHFVLRLTRHIWI